MIYQFPIFNRLLLARVVLVVDHGNHALFCLLLVGLFLVLLDRLQLLLLFDLYEVPERVAETLIGLGGLPGTLELGEEVLQFLDGQEPEEGLDLDPEVFELAELPEDL